MATYEYTATVYQSKVCAADIVGLAQVTGPVEEVKGVGWKYNVRMGWRGQFAAAFRGDVTFQITLGSGNNATTSTYVHKGGVYTPGGPGNLTSKTWLSPTFSITVKYNQTLSGRMGADCPTIAWTCYLNGRVYSINALNFGQVIYAKNDPSTGKPAVSPKPSEPPKPSKLVVANVTNITATSAYIAASLYGNSETQKKYHMRVKNKATGAYIANPFYTTAYTDYETANKTVTGLQPETTYTFVYEVYDSDGNKLNDAGFTVEKTFTTKTDQAYIYRKDTAWRRGKAWIKVGSSWQKGKRVYHKVNGQWKASKGNY